MNRFIFLLNKVTKTFSVNFGTIINIVRAWTPLSTESISFDLALTNFASSLLKVELIRELIRERFSDEEKD